MAVAITQTANPAGAAASSNVATYSGVSIGTVDPDRIVVVLVSSELANSIASACTIDYGSGDTAMSLGNQNSQGVLYARAFYLAVPTGTTATIKVTYSATNPGSTQNHISVYSVTGATFSSTGADSSADMDTTDALTTGSTTIASNGGMIAIAACANDTTAHTWANLTGDIDADVGNHRHMTATYTTAGTATRTLTGVTTGEDGALSWLIFTEKTNPTLQINKSDSSTITESLNMNSAFNVKPGLGRGVRIVTP